MTSAKSSKSRKLVDRYFNRELSWLQFNHRVLDEARDPDVPILERLKFLAITASNLDEFFMVRMGGLQILKTAKSSKRDPSGLTPTQQLVAAGTEARAMMEAQYACYNEELEPALEAVGVCRIRPDQLSAKQRTFVERHLAREVYSVLTPMAVQTAGIIPLLANHRLHLAVRLKPDAEAEDDPPEPRYAVIPMAQNLSRFVTLPYAENVEWILLDDLVAANVSELFPGETVMECVPFRITRNADMGVREDMAADLMTHMEEALGARKTSQCIRLEVDDVATRMMTRFLQDLLQVRYQDVYRINGPLDLSDFFALAGSTGRQEHQYESWDPLPCPALPTGASIFSVLQERDLLLYHPYESFEPLLRMLNEAANDPDVLAIKMILYRTSRDSQVVDALIRAAENGKHVSAVVELKARFDEARNIDQARALEQAGVQVIYGAQRLKTHAKLCAVVRREDRGIVRYLQFGTGNYNEVTAGLYSDVSLFTCDPQLGADASAFFNAITGYTQPQAYAKLVAAPTGLRARLLQLIDGETERKKQGQKAMIQVKMNSLVDPEIIDRLYAASKAGVRIKLNIRGICCLRPGVKGLSENISVVSIIDRYLEHARVVYFYHGGDRLVYISSADWMPRNLDRRIETFVPVEDKECKKRLLHILDTHFKDERKGRVLQADGCYLRAESSKKAGSQETLYKETKKAVQAKSQADTTVFKPHLPAQS